MGDGREENRRRGGTGEEEGEGREREGRRGKRKTRKATEAGRERGTSKVRKAW